MKVATVVYKRRAYRSLDRLVATVGKGKTPKNRNTVEKKTDISIAKIKTKPAKTKKTKAKIPKTKTGPKPTPRLLPTRLTGEALEKSFKGS